MNIKNHLIGPLATFLLSTSVFAQTNVLTQHNDIGRTGQNLTETVLTPQNVNPNTFGKLYSMALDGQAYAQPLYLSSVNIANVNHSVLFVATEHDSVYAFDTNAGGAQLWKASLLDSAHGAAAGAIPDPQSDTGCADVVGPEYGITGTPVIDPATGTLYVVSLTFENNYPVQRLHALDVTSGAEKFGGPVTISASVPATGNGSSNGVLTFDPKWNNQRAGLLFLNGTVYIAWGSHCDNGPWHGWLMGYTAASGTLKQAGVFVSSPNGSADGIWMSGAGLAADNINGVPRMFVATGNGDFDSNGDWGESVLNLNLSNGIKVQDSFTPNTQSSLTSSDLDVASAGTLVLPDQPGAHPHLALQLSKAGVMFLLNREKLGGYNNSSDQALQEVTFGPYTLGLWGIPAYFNGNVYFWAAQGTMMQYSLTNGLLSTSPITVGSQTETGVGGGYYSGNFLGASPSISANGSTNGIVWVDDWVRDQGNPIQYLYAYDANNLGKVLWTSTANPSRDGAGASQKFAVPTIADGKVFLAAYDQMLVYGLLPPSFTLSSLPAATTVAPGSSANIQLNVSSFGGFTGTVSFAATGLPTGVTATFSPITSGAVTLTLTATSSAAMTTTPATVTITGTSGTLSSSIPLSLSVAKAIQPVPVNMSSAFNVYGFFNNGSSITNGGFDGAGYAYSANALGTSLSALGVSFTFGTPGTANSASSAIVPLPAGSFATLNLVGAAVFGNQTSQPFVVTYTDGTTSTFTQSLSDWGSPQGNAGESVALAMPYRLTPSSSQDARPFNLYGYSFPLNSAKTVQSITLPANRDVIILAMTLSGQVLSFGPSVKPNNSYAALTSGTNAVTFNVTNPGTLGTPIVFTEGTPSSSLTNPDFTLASNGTTCTGSVTNGSCTVSVQFTPQFGGLRRGAVKIFDSNNNLLATAFVYGVGSASPVAPVLASAKTIANTGSIRGVAVDAAGDVFYVDNNAAQVYKASPGKAASALNLGLTLNSPFGVAVDAAGNLYIADTGNNRIVELAYGSSAATPLNITGLNFPEGIAVDGSGNLLIANTLGASSTGSGNIVKVAASSGTQTTIATGGLGSPSAVTVDAAGDIFFADWSNNRVLEVPASGGAPHSIGSGLNHASAVAVDAAGDVFIADENNNQIVEVPGTSSGPGTGTQVVVATGFSIPYSLAFDGQGDLFVANVGSNSTTNGSLVELPVSTTSSKSQTITFGAITAQTVGSSLTLTATASSGLLVSFASSTTSVCSLSGSTASLLTAGTCTITASQAGNNSYSAAPSVSQSFTVNLKPQTITFNAIAAQTVGSSLTLTATANSGLPVTYTVVQNGNCSVSGSVVTFLNVGNCGVIANQAGNSTYSAAATVGQIIVVNNTTPQTITFNAIATQTVGSTLTLTASASSGLAVSYSSSTTGVCTVSGSTATLLTAGTCTITASQPGNSTYSAATPVSQSFTVNAAASPVIVTLAAATLAQGNYNAFTASISGASTAPTTLGLGGVPCVNIAGCIVNLSGNTIPLNFEFSNVTNTSASLGVYVSASVPPGTYAIPVTIGTTKVGTFTLTVPQLTQTITFGAIASQTVGTPLSLTATATSGLPVSYSSSTTGVCTVSASTATLLTAGTCTITASQAGNGTYSAATSVSQSFTVAAKTASFTIATSTATFNLPRNQGGTVNVTATPANGFNGTVTYTLTGMPSGASYTFLPQSSTFSILVIYVPSTVTPGTYTIKVTGASGTSTATTTFTLIVS